MILFDLGALEYLCKDKKFILVTNDKFGQSAEECFRNEQLKSTTSSTEEIRSLKKQRILQNGRFVELALLEGSNFEWVSTCKEAALALGRVQIY